MKLQISKVVIMLIVSFSFVQSHGQVIQSDPGLTSAVATGHLFENQELNGIKNAQEKITIAQTAILGQLNVIREYEEKTFNYLKNAQEAIKNGHDLIVAANLTVEIGKNLNHCIDEAVNNPVGISTLAINKLGVTVIDRMVGIYSHIASIVLKGDDNSSGEGVNLLSSADRSMVIDRVIYELRNINNSLIGLSYQIEYMKIAHIPQQVFPIDYYYINQSQEIATDIIGKFKNK